MAFSHVQQDGGHGSGQEGDVFEACSLMALTHVDQDGGHAIEMGVTSSAHAL